MVKRASQPNNRELEMTLKRMEKERLPTAQMVEQLVQQLGVTNEKALQIVKRYRADQKQNEFWDGLKAVATGLFLCSPLILSSLGLLEVVRERYIFITIAGALLGGLFVLIGIYQIIVSFIPPRGD